MKHPILPRGAELGLPLASGILLTLFGERAAMPASVFAVFGVLHVVWLGFRFRKGAQPEATAASPLPETGPGPD